VVYIKSFYQSQSKAQKIPTKLYNACVKIECKGTYTVYKTSKIYADKLASMVMLA